jgi:hypothetical protein
VPDPCCGSGPWMLKDPRPPGSCNHSCVHKPHCRWPCFRTGCIWTRRTQHPVTERDSTRSWSTLFTVRFSFLSRPHNLTCDSPHIGDRIMAEVKLHAPRESGTCAGDFLLYIWCGRYHYGHCTTIFTAFRYEGSGSGRCTDCPRPGFRDCCKSSPNELSTMRMEPTGC